MATEPFNTYVTTLTSATAVAGTDVVYINQSGISKKATITQLAGPIAGLPWINVKDSPYNATGNGITDDTPAINLAIAALNTATKGALYFPAGTYLVSSSLTTITANGIIRGDGMSVFGAGGVLLGPSTVIKFTATATSLFTTNYTDNNYLQFTDLSLFYSGTTPTAGSAGITVTANLSGGGQKVDYRNITVNGFYNCIDVQTGFEWTMDNCIIVNPVNYGVRIRNINFPDSGDWQISNSAFYADQHSAPAGIRIESSGGGKIVNCKVNNLASPQFVNGIDVLGTGVTVDLLVCNCSMENISGNGFNASGSWPGIGIINCQFGDIGSNDISIASTTRVSIVGCIHSFGAPFGVVSLTSVTDFSVSSLLYMKLLTSSTGVVTAGTDTQGSAWGDGAGGQYFGCVSSGNTFPGTFGVTSNGRTDLFVNSATGSLASFTLGNNGNPVYFLSTDSTAVLSLFGGTIASGSQILNVGATVGSNFALANRKLVAAASTTTAASLNIPSGTAPTSPADGDMWYDGTNIKFQIGASTKTFTVT